MQVEDDDIMEERLYFVYTMKINMIGLADELHISVRKIKRGMTLAAKQNHHPEMRTEGKVDLEPTKVLVVRFVIYKHFFSTPHICCIYLSFSLPSISHMTIIVFINLKFSE